MIAIKNWFLIKNQMRGIKNASEIHIVRETEKAVFIGYTINEHKYEHWIPKSVIIDEWEKDTSNFGYHDYLVSIYHKAYANGLMGEISTIKSGRNVYRGDAFIHQQSTKDLMDSLNRHNVKFMNRAEWNNR